MCDPFCLWTTLFPALNFYYFQSTLLLKICNSVRFELAYSHAQKSFHICTIRYDEDNCYCPTVFKATFFEGRKEFLNFAFDYFLPLFCFFMRKLPHGDTKAKTKSKYGGIKILGTTKIGKFSCKIKLQDVFQNFFFWSN